MITAKFLEPSGTLQSTESSKPPRKQDLSLSHFTDVKTKAQTRHLLKSHSW